MSLRDVIEKMGRPRRDRELEEIQSRYIKVFGTAEGQLVFTDMLLNLGFFDYNQSDPVSLERMNFARFLLGRMGIWDPVKVAAITGSLIKLSGVKVSDRGR